MRHPWAFNSIWGNSIVSNSTPDERFNPGRCLRMIQNL
jgi:hypothetical protein